MTPCGIESLPRSALTWPVLAISVGCAKTRQRLNCSKARRAWLVPVGPFTKKRTACGDSARFFTDQTGRLPKNWKSVAGGRMISFLLRKVQVQIVLHQLQGQDDLISDLRMLNLAQVLVKQFIS